jgi:hypothetical protein
MDHQYDILQQCKVQYKCIHCIGSTQVYYYYYYYYYYFLWLCSLAPAMASFSQCFVITHNGEPESVGLLWTSDQFVAETFT